MGLSESLERKVFPNAIRIENIDSATASHSTFNDIAWSELENKNFRRSIQLYKRALILYPSEAYLYVNLAHAYLLSNEYENAIRYYNLFLDKKLLADYPKEKMLQEDFIYLKSKGFPSESMDKALKELNITTSKH